MSKLSPIQERAITRLKHAREEYEEDGRVKWATFLRVSEITANTTASLRRRGLLVFENANVGEFSVPVPVPMYQEEADSE